MGSRWSDSGNLIAATQCVLESSVAEVDNIKLGERMERWSWVMNIALLIAGLICLFGAVFHEVVGTPKIAAPIVASDLDIQVKTIAKIVWHSIAYSLFFSGIALIYFAFGNPNVEASLLIMAYVFSFAGLFWFICAKLMGNANAFPHPWVFSTIGVCIGVGVFVLG
jgi:hypothetical protein